jgi:hypothetical protein
MAEKKRQRRQRKQLRNPYQRSLDRTDNLDPDDVDTFLDGIYAAMSEESCCGLVGWNVGRYFDNKKDVGAFLDSGITPHPSKGQPPLDLEKHCDFLIQLRQTQAECEQGHINESLAIGTDRASAALWCRSAHTLAVRFPSSWAKGADRREANANTAENFNPMEQFL